MVSEAIKAEAPGGALELRVHGLDCAEEVAALKRAVAPAAGGEEHLAFDVLRGTAWPARRGLRPGATAAV